MNNYKPYNPAEDPLTVSTKNVASLADVMSDYATTQAFHTTPSCIVLNLDGANEITLTYNHRTYTLDKDRLFMFLTTMFMKED